MAQQNERSRSRSPIQLKSTEEPAIKLIEEPAVKSTEKPVIKSTEEPAIKSTEEPENVSESSNDLQITETEELDDASEPSIDEKSGKNVGPEKDEVSTENKYLEAKPSSTLSTSFENKPKDTAENCCTLYLAFLPHFWNYTRVLQFLRDNVKSVPILNAHVYVAEARKNGVKTGEYLIHFDSPAVCHAVHKELNLGRIIFGDKKLTVKLDIGNAIALAKTNFDPGVFQRRQQFKIKHKEDEESKADDGTVDLNDHSKKKKIEDNGSGSLHSSPNELFLPREKLTDGTYGLSTSFLNSLSITPPLTRRIRVSNLDRDVDEAKLREVFGLAGIVISAKILSDIPGSLPYDLGKAKIEFDHPVEAVQAISMFNNQQLGHRRMKVTMDFGPKIRLPVGLWGVGKGLGANGERLTGISAKMEVEPVKKILKDMGKIENDTSTSKFPFTNPPSMNTSGKSDILNNSASSQASIPNTINTQNQQSLLLGLSALLQGMGNQNLQNSVPNMQRDQFMSNMGQNLPNLGQNFTNLAQNLTNLGQNVPTLGQNLTNLGQNVPNLGQNVPNLGQNAPNLGQNAPNLGQNAPNLGQNAPNLGQNAPNLGQNVPNFGQNTLYMGNNLVNMGQNISAIDHKLSNISPNLTNINQSVAQIEQNYIQTKQGFQNTSNFNWNVPQNRNEWMTQESTSSSAMQRQSTESASTPVHYNQSNKEARRDYESAFVKENQHVGSSSTEKQNAMLLFNNLPPSVTVQALNSKMREVGEIMFGEMTGEGRAIVRFKHFRDAERCIKLFNRSKVDGEIIDVNYF